MNRGFYKRFVVLVALSMLIAGCGQLSLPGGKTVTVSIYYGSEKQAWLEPLVEEYNAQKNETEEGSTIGVASTPMGSIESANAIIGGGNSTHGVESGLVGLYPRRQRRVAQR